MHIHEIAARTLADLKVAVIFGVIGDGNLFMMDSFERHAGGRYVSVANESSAVLAASGYARVSGRLGVASVTRGPGLSNVVTALIASVKDRTPLLLVTGDTPVADRENFQNIPQREIVTGTGSGFEQVRGPDTVGDDTRAAVHRAYSERRPIVLNVPVEFQWMEAEYRRVRPIEAYVQAVAPDPEALDVAVGIIAGARRPIVLGGRGAISPSARTSLLRLANRIGAPIATTLQAKDLFRGEPFDLGVYGTLAQPASLEVMMQSDCIIAFGAGLNRYTAAKGSLFENKRIIQIDNRLEGLSQHISVDAAVLGDAARTADQMTSWLDEADIPSSGFASGEMNERLTSQSKKFRPEPDEGERVDIKAALARIEESFPRDRAVIVDTGHFITDAFSMLHVTHPASFVFTTSYGCIGLGMGNAIGASFAAPEQPVLLVCGDGGFMLGGLAEFNTAVRHKADVTVIVLNDGAYGAEYIQFRSRGMDPSISTFEWPDLGPVAASLGGRGFTVRNLEELDGALASLARREVPTLIDVKINRDDSSSGHG